MMTKYLRVTMPDGSQWDVLVDFIARHRAAFYADRFGGDIERSLKEGTLPLFARDGYRIRDWAVYKMKWADVQAVAVQVKPPEPVDYDEGLVNGDWEIIEK